MAVDPVGRMTKGTIFLQGEWLGQEDSNFRMTESKSVAVTNLAMPQCILYLPRIYFYQILSFIHRVYRYLRYQ